MSSPPFQPRMVSEQTKPILMGRIGRMIQMYQDIADGHIVRKWVCLCNDSICRRCPCEATYPQCVGPGGIWQPIGALVHAFNHYCTESTEEVELDDKFRLVLKECVDAYVHNKDKPRSYWTYEHITVSAAKKAAAWRVWLTTFRSS